eukprot:scaffold2201_cov68-Phaeocystis_antarctica.AAC.2
MVGRPLLHPLQHALDVGLDVLHSVAAQLDHDLLLVRLARLVEHDLHDLRLHVLRQLLLRVTSALQPRVEDAVLRPQHKHQVEPPLWKELRSVEVDNEPARLLHLLELVEYPLLVEYVRLVFLVPPLMHLSVLYERAQLYVAHGGRLRSQRLAHRALAGTRRASNEDVWQLSRLLCHDARVLGADDAARPEGENRPARRPLHAHAPATRALGFLRVDRRRAGRVDPAEREQAALHCGPPGERLRHLPKPRLDLARAGHADGVRVGQRGCDGRGLGAGHVHQWQEAAAQEEAHAAAGQVARLWQVNPDLQAARGRLGLHERRGGGAGAEAAEAVQRDPRHRAALRAEARLARRQREAAARRLDPN